MIILKYTLNFIFILFILTSDLYADKSSGVERIRSCSATDGFVSPFDPLYVSDGTEVKIGKELEYSFRDPVCLAQFLRMYAQVKIGIASINSACGTGSPIPRPFPSLVSDFKDLALASNKARTDKNCLKAMAIAVSTNIIVAFQHMGTIYEIAKAEFGRVRVCGSDWLDPNENSYTFDDKGSASYKKIIQDKLNDKVNVIPRNNTSKEFREYINGGKEFEDNVGGDEVCMDPATNKPQKYYLRGTRQGIYGCEKYNPSLINSGDEADYAIAYKCCLKRSREFICLEKNALSSADVAIWNQTDHIFCQANSKCVFKNNIAVIYEAYKRDNGRLICARSTSVCPFNFSIGGGTIYPDYFKDGKFENDKFKPFIPTNLNGVINDSKCLEKSEVRNQDCTFNNKAGKLKNFCQYYTHCTVADTIFPSANYDSLSPYFSKACIDFVGDSKNGISGQGLSSNLGVGIGDQTQFSAPIVQCIKETMFNVFQNTFGHSRCLDGSYGDHNNLCIDSNGQNIYQRSSEGFEFKIGNKVKRVSFFETVQKNLKNIITLVLVISMSFFGYKLIMAKVDLENRKEILTYIFKIFIVIYFVNGDAWKSIFFDGVYNGSNQISQIFFKVKTNNLKDKCNFGAMYDRDGNNITTIIQYPPGKEYLMIWDTLDCKIMEYLNYGPGFSSSTLFTMIIAGFFTWGIGLAVGLSVFIMAIFMISSVVRAMHIFISSAIGIIIYVFMSPIIIPLVLFERTKSIFDAWLSHLMSFTLQPIILFSYIAIYVTLTDQIFYGDYARNENSLDCRQYCVNTVDNQKVFDLNQCSTNKDMTDVIDPKNTVAACIVRFDEYGENGSFALIGVTLSTLGEILKNDPEVKIVLILKTALFLYLLSQFMDEIPGISSRLIGENIDVRTGNLYQNMKKLQGNIRDVQKRATRFVKIQAQSKFGSARDKASESKDKKDDDKGGSSDSVGSSDSGRDSGSSGSGSGGNP